MANNIMHEAATALQQDWGLRLPVMLTEEELLRLLADKIVGVIEQGPDAFFQLMYRLDISEKKLRAVMHGDDAAMKIARLIYDRQLQKIQSRMANRRAAESDDPELKW